MRFNLLTSIEAFCEEKKVSELVNDLQLFFIITPQEPRIEIPIDEVNALPLTPERIRSHIKGLGMINSPATIFITSRPISPFRELFWDHDVPILSNNRTENRADANAVWLARRLLHIGMSLFAKTACLDTTCVCNNLDNFLTLCGQCEEKLRSQGYRDGIARLKDGINWLNQRYEVAKPDLIVHPLINPDTHLTLADYPINFYGSESLPNDTIDPIMTLLLLCGIDVCEKQLSPEIHTDYVNDDLQKKHKLVEEFLKLCMST